MGLKFNLNVVSEEVKVVNLNQVPFCPPPSPLQRHSAILEGTRHSMMKHFLVGQGLEVRRDSWGYFSLRLISLLHGPNMRQSGLLCCSHGAAPFSLSNVWPWVLALGAALPCCSPDH